MARIITETFTDRQGREVGLSVAARIFLVIGIAAVPVCAVLAITSTWIAWIVLGVVCMVVGVTLYLNFVALAEIIRLLKKLAGLPYGGVISGSSTGDIFLCSECGSLVWADSTTCTKCGAEFENIGERKSSGNEGPNDLHTGTSGGNTGMNQ